jgi:hypothetical protein
MGVPGARGYLLLRRAGGVWGIANEAVDGLSREGAGNRAGYRIAVGAETLVADEIVGVVETLRVVPAAPALARFWPEAAAGMAVHGGVPVVVVDPRRLPAVLRREGRAEGEEGEEG